MEKQKTYFLGCPTPQGFSTHLFDDIYAGGFKTYIIKGGPGTGKSSMMKKIANELSDIDAPELYYCSSDPASLDAVLFRKLKVIVVDGTAPHVVEPEYPGVSQIIVDLGACWNLDEMKNNREAIIETTVANKKCHELVRRYLTAIHSINEDVYAIGESAINKTKLDSYCERLLVRILPKIKQEGGGSICYRQITSITPDGVITHDSLFKGMNVFRINDDYYAVADRIMKNLAEKAAMQYDVIVSINVFLGDNVYEQIIIPELKIAFVTGEIELSSAVSNINAQRFYDRNILREKKGRLVFDKGIAGELISEAVSTLNLAKDIHDDLESCYIKAMDFGKVNNICKELIARIRQEK